MTIKAHNMAVAAVARELVGFIWAVLSQAEAAGDNPKQNKEAKEKRYVLKPRSKNVGWRRCA